MNKLHAVEIPAWHVAYICYSVQIQNVSLPCYNLIHHVLQVSMHLYMVSTDTASISIVESGNAISIFSHMLKQKTCFNYIEL